MVFYSDLGLVPLVGSAIRETASQRWEPAICEMCSRFWGRPTLGREDPGRRQWAWRAASWLWVPEPEDQGDLLLRASSAYDQQNPFRGGAASLA